MISSSLHHLFLIAGHSVEQPSEFFASVEIGNEGYRFLGATRGYWRTIRVPVLDREPPKTAESIVLAIPEHFFDQYPHRMACVRSAAFICLRARRKYSCSRAKPICFQLRQEIPLSDSELAAVDDGVAAMEKLLEQLADVPTPAGPTPRELGNRVCDDKG